MPKPSSSMKIPCTVIALICMNLEWVWVKFVGWPFKKNWVSSSLCVTQPESLLVFTAWSYSDFSSLEPWDWGRPLQPGYASWLKKSHMWVSEQPIPCLCPFSPSQRVFFNSLVVGLLVHQIWFLNDGSSVVQL